MKHYINLMWPYVGTDFVIIRSCIVVYSSVLDPTPDLSPLPSANGIDLTILPFAKCQFVYSLHVSANLGVLHVRDCMYLQQAIFCCFCYLHLQYLSVLTYQ